VIEDESPVEDGTEAPAEPQPTDEAGDVIAPPADDAPEGDEAGNPPVEASVQDEAELDEGVEVIDGEVVPNSVGESISSGEGGETTPVGSQPQTLNSGDELPAHRQRVESGEASE
jgi:hypothetical protein